MLTVREHTSKSYSPRTYANAREGDITIAIAVDYNTAGERCTKKAAGGLYPQGKLLELPPDNLAIDNARLLYKVLKKINGKAVNVAGNGIYTLVKHGFCQEEINQYVFDILAQVHTHWPIEKLISGGQTGVDLAGGVAGFALGIPTVMTLPKGFIQRASDGIDREYSEEEIRKQVEYYAGMLEK